jgi:hypothetical protein
MAWCLLKQRDFIATTITIIISVIRIHFNTSIRRQGSPVAMKKYNRLSVTLSGLSSRHAVAK